MRLIAHGLRPVHARPPPAHRCCCCCTSLGCGPCSLWALRPLPPCRISLRICSVSSLHAHMTAAVTQSPAATTAVVSAETAVPLRASVPRPITPRSYHRRMDTCRRTVGSQPPVYGRTSAVMTTARGIVRHCREHEKKSAERYEYQPINLSPFYHHHHHHHQYTG